MSQQLPESVLYVTGKTTDGRPVVGGAYRAHDEFGFPISMSYEIMKEKGWVLDWLEALAYAGAQGDKDPAKLFSLLDDELPLLLGAEEAKKVADGFKFLAASYMPQVTRDVAPDYTCAACCKLLLAEKQKSAAGLAARLRGGSR